MLGVKFGLRRWLFPSNYCAEAWATQLLEIRAARTEGENINAERPERSLLGSTAR